MIVRNVKFVNNKVQIILDETSFLISKENYIENPLAINSDISESKINELLNHEYVIESKGQIIKLLNRKALSEKEIVVKLKEKGLAVKDINDIIDSLKRAGLINDEYVALINVDSLILKRKGRLEIIKVLKEKGIKQNQIYKVINEIDEEVYEDNFYKVFEKYLKVYNNKSHKIKEQMIISKLKEYGYEDEYISKIKFVKNLDEEIELARLNLNKILKTKKIDVFSYENINKIKSKLVMKGFSYDIINKVIEEVVSNETH